MYAFSVQACRAIKWRAVGVTVHSLIVSCMTTSKPRIDTVVGSLLNNSQRCAAFWDEFQEHPEHGSLSVYCTRHIRFSVVNG